MKYFYLFLLFLFISTIENNLIAQNNRSISVSIHISADDIIENRLYSYISREIREFNDIYITNGTDVNYEIRVLCIEANTKSGYTSGYDAALSVYEPYTYKDALDDFSFQAYIDGNNNYDNIKARIDSTFIGKVLQFQLSSTYKISYSSLLVDSDLESISERIVANINTKVFEPVRSNWDEFDKLINNNN